MVAHVLVVVTAVVHVLPPHAIGVWVDILRTLMGVLPVFLIVRYAITRTLVRLVSLVMVAPPIINVCGACRIALIATAWAFVFLALQDMV